MKDAGKKTPCLKCRTVVEIPWPELLPRVGCPHCKAELDFPVSAAGSIERCIKCGAAVQVPDVAGKGNSGCIGLFTSSLVGGLIAALSMGLLR